MASKCVREHPSIKELTLSDQQFREVHCIFMDEIKKGLNKCSHEKSDVKCFITYVQDFPTGKEVGKCLALDLGGTNFRVLLVTFKLGEEPEVVSNIYEIPEEIYTATGVQLFDHIASCLADFMKMQSVTEEELPLGFTFSFPLKQVSLSKGILVAWTKAFNCPDVIGRDVVFLLKEAIQRRGDIRVDVMAILNDTTGTLISCAHKNPNCRIGCIVGTGTNACYVEKVINAELYDGPKDKPFVIINCEWGAFGDSGTLDFIRTDFDVDVDLNSINPGKQIHEKMISGMYMGELVRLVIQKFVSEGILFRGKGSEKLFTRNTFKTKHVSQIESDNIGCYIKCQQVLLEMAITNATDRDCANVRFVCEVVSKRSAYLCGSALAALLNKMDMPCVTIGVDGSLFRMHPFFERHMHSKIYDLTCRRIKFDVMLSEDGSGVGAALIASVIQMEIDNINKELNPASSVNVTPAT